MEAARRSVGGFGKGFADMSVLKMERYLNFCRGQLGRQALKGLDPPLQQWQE